MAPDCEAAPAVVVGGGRPARARAAAAAAGGRRRSPAPVSRQATASLREPWLPGPGGARGWASGRLGARSCKGWSVWEPEDTWGQGSQGLGKPGSREIPGPGAVKAGGTQARGLQGLGYWGVEELQGPGNCRD